MAHDEVNPIDGLNFVDYTKQQDSLPGTNLGGIRISEWMTQLAIDWGVAPARAANIFNEYFTNTVVDATHKLPVGVNLASNLNTFFTHDLLSYIKAIPGTNPVGPENEDMLLSNYVKAITGMPGFADDHTPFNPGSFAIFNATITDINNQYIAWFNHFLQTFPYKGSTRITADDFNNALKEELKLVAILRPSNFIDQLPSSDFFVASYENIYKTFFPTATEEEFLTRINTFYQEQITDHGYFIPSQAVRDWQQTLFKEYLITLNPALNQFIDNTTLAGAQFDKLLIIDRIYNLIAKLLNVMQRVAFFQARRLSFLTQWQRVYSDMISTIHVFSAGDGTKVTDATQRDTLNQTINQGFRDNLQAARSVIGDDAKALQSNINQTNDAVTQQANMATALIQELNSLLNTIYR